MKARSFSLGLVSAFVCLPYVANAESEDALKERYLLSSIGGVESFYVRDGSVEAPGFVCNVGQALPDASLGREWYRNSSIPGLELRIDQKVAAENYVLSGKAASVFGLAYLVKDNQELERISPDERSSQFGRDDLVRWNIDGTEVFISTPSYQISFDVVSGNGFLYKGLNLKEPDYFLSGCTRIMRKVPYYKHVITGISSR